ncbi:hypothetical protein [Candidatus Poriferisocius sp.]|uniref:hypothetical protein n=1 Tax=Candidatus Poriferisocius sp. TaxID=3101276 RepID=UPI003B01A6D0
MAKSADGSEVLAQVRWGYHDSIGCYLVLDDEAVWELRGGLPEVGPQASLGFGRRFPCLPVAGGRCGGVLGRATNLGRLMRLRGVSCRCQPG